MGHVPMRPTKKGFSSSKLDVNAMMLGVLHSFVKPHYFLPSQQQPLECGQLPSFDLQPPYVKMEEC
jgi:hypothetical protein